VHYLRKIEIVIEYIEAHLSEDIDIFQLANTSGYSPWVLTRVFRAIVGESLTTYILKRKLTMAAADLCDTAIDIDTLATKYSFTTEDVFVRAFHEAYNMTPSKYREKQRHQSLREPMIIDYLKIEHEHQKKAEEPTIKYMEQMDICGKEIDVQLEVQVDGSNIDEIPLFWQAWHKGAYGKIIPYSKYENDCIGLYKSTYSRNYKFMIGVPVHLFSDDQEDYVTYTIPAAVYAVFTASRPIDATVQSTWDYIYGVWLNTSKYRRSTGDEFEYYYLIEGELYADIYIPIEKKGT